VIAGYPESQPDCRRAGALVAALQPANLMRRTDPWVSGTARHPVGSPVAGPYDLIICHGVLHLVECSAVFTDRLAPPDDLAPFLEVGCGTGNYLSAIRASVGCECIGTDPSRAMLEWLRGRDPGIQAVEGKAEQLPLPDASFDLVFCVDVIHHVENREKAFREASRVLRAGGHICTVTDSERIIRNREPLSTYFPGTVPTELSRYPSLRELKSHAKCGFRFASREGCGVHL
jgi:SAM-dependent methyltransferase